MPGLWFARVWIYSQTESEYMLPGLDGCVGFGFIYRLTSLRLGWAWIRPQTESEKDICCLVCDLVAWVRSGLTQTLKVNTCLLPGLWLR